MKICWCKLILSLLIIVLVWWAPSWANWGITVLAAVIALTSLFGFCCGGTCSTKKGENQ